MIETALPKIIHLRPLGDRRLGIAFADRQGAFDFSWLSNGALRGVAAE
jgi:hypothetical protein